MGRRNLIVLAMTALALSCTSGPRQTPESTAPATVTGSKALLPEADARYLLGRAAFGPAPGDVEHLAAIGLDAWLDEQLNPKAKDPDTADVIAPYSAVLGTPKQLIRRFAKTKDDGELLDGDGSARVRLKERELLRTLQMVELGRHIASRQQLREVMVDFWVNHFNVLGTKGQLAIATPDYVEGIRERALGSFSDLLLWTAEHPAMLIYLDNSVSVALPEDDGFRGLNENYARELLELHTLGVDGGYTQKDVRELARVLTGWGVHQRRDGALAFAFHARKHDQQSKVLLGERIEPNGRAEGEAALLRLARHPATAHHLATKLCRRFVADDPPAQCVDDVSAAYQASDGDIGQTLRALFESKAFWAESVRNQKFKSPLEFAVSAARALGARPDGSNRLARRLGNLGEGLFLYPPPTGYPERTSAWLSSGALLARMDLAVQIARGKAAGLTRGPTERSGTPEQALARAEQRVLGGPASAETRRAIATELEHLERPRQRELTALALLIGSPEFQRQ